MNKKAVGTWALHINLRSFKTLLIKYVHSLRGRSRINSCSFVEKSLTPGTESLADRVMSAMSSTSSLFNDGLEGSTTWIECAPKCLTGSLSSINGSIIGLTESMVGLEVGSMSRMRLPFPLALTGSVMLSDIVLVEISRRPNGCSWLDDKDSSDSSLIILKMDGVEGWVWLEERSVDLKDVVVVDAAGDNVVVVAVDPTACVAVLPFLLDADDIAQRSKLSRSDICPVVMHDLTDYACTFFCLLNITQFIPPLCLELQNVLDFLLVHKVAPTQHKKRFMLKSYVAWLSWLPHSATSNALLHVVLVVKLVILALDSVLPSDLQSGMLRVINIQDIVGGFLNMSKESRVAIVESVTHFREHLTDHNQLVSL